MTRHDCFYHGVWGRGNATHVVDDGGDRRPVCRDLADEFRRRGYDVDEIEAGIVEP